MPCNICTVNQRASGFTTLTMVSITAPQSLLMIHECINHGPKKPIKVAWARALTISDSGGLKLSSGCGCAGPGTAPPSNQAMRRCWRCGKLCSIHHDDNSVRFKMLYRLSCTRDTSQRTEGAGQAMLQVGSQVTSRVRGRRLFTKEKDGQYHC